MNIKKLVFVQIEFRFVFVADATRYVKLFCFSKKTLSEKQIYRDFIKTLNQLYHATKHLPNCIEFIKGKWQYMQGFFVSKKW